jgi:tricorn protease
MIGELNASHTGVSGPATRSMDRLYSTRYLGFELIPGQEYYRVGHVYRDGPADKEWHDISEGDYVLAIDGHDLAAGENYYPILNHLLNTYVEVKIASPVEDEAEGESIMAEPRTLRIRPVSSLRNIKYEEWVHNNRQYVDEASGGKVGYVHIRSMGRSSLARFEEEINEYWNKNGMIIDIRYNGGGNIDQQLIDILERKPYEYWNYRNGGRAWGRRPRQAIAGPQVMLINWRSASDSEVTPQAFRDLNLGRIVGNPTYGAVIATGSYRLLNGGRIRTPGSLVVTYDPTQEHNYGINLENFGVAPDVFVENTPEDELVGYDRELKAAVDEALRMLAEGTWQYGEDE